MGSTSSPKQFLKVHGKPVIVYTLERFEYHPDVDAIIVVCIKSHIDHLKELASQYRLSKVKSVVEGGSTGQDSIYRGLKEAERLFSKDSFVLIHDGVRPFVSADTLTSNIKTAHACGNAITVTKVSETIVTKNDKNEITNVLDRSLCFTAKAPQTFILKDILDAHRRAIKDGFSSAIDSASLMAHYGHTLHVVEGNLSNLKVTTVQDFYFMRAIIDMVEDKQLSLL